MKNIVIIGAGDLGKEIVWLIEDINKRKPTYLILGFLDDDVSKYMNTFYGYRVLGTVNELEHLSGQMPVSAVIAIQKGSIRKKIVEEHPTFNSWETIIHPSANIASTSTIGDGSVVFPNVSISVDSKLGRFTLFYIHATICNDCLIGDYVSIMTGASVLEHSEIGNECFLSAGSCVYPHKKLGNGVQVGVEATVCHNYGDGREVNEKGMAFSILK